MYCNRCFEEIPDGSTKCPFCGADLTKGNSGKKKIRGSLFGGNKKKAGKTGSLHFDENGNLIGNNTSNSNDNTGGGRNSEGETERGSKPDSKILIILGASLLLIIAFITCIFIIMKKQGGNNNGTRHTTGVVSADTSSDTDSSVHESVTPEAATPTTPEAAMPTVTPTAVATPTSQLVSESKSDSVKSSFDEDTADSFFWPYSDSRLYTFEDLENLSIQQIEFVKAEIYAREGCIFKDEKYNDYFKKKSWFRGSIDESKFKPDRHLNYYEIENVRMINTYLKEKK